MSEAINHDRRRFLGAGAMTIAAFQFGQIGSAKAQSSIKEPANPLPIEGGFPSLDGATKWLNSPTLTASRLRGKVLLIDFWTYTCINWRRTLPYIRAWAGKYKDQGLVVIGVSTPEFEFEKNVDNVRWALKDMRIDYPIAIDNDYAIWRAFKNEYWPALYFVDAKGHMRHHYFGEGEYEQSERVIQQLLAETGTVGISNEPATVDASGLEAAPDLKPPPIGIASSLRKTMSATSARRVSLLPVVQDRTSAPSTPPPPGWHLISGLFQVTGRWRNTPLR
jgi:thiol-disulfide isomerase/thioredoxin